MEALNEDIYKELTGRIKNGEKEAFRELFDLFAPKIFRFAFSLLNNEPDAEELLQIVFMKLWENREYLNPEQNLRAYISKIAVNGCYDFIRKKNIEKAFLEFSAHNFRVDTESLWHEIIRNEMLSNLDRLVKQMPDQRLKIFRLSREEGMNTREIACRLNLSRRTVENQLYRALLFLKEKFKSGSF